MFQNVDSFTDIYDFSSDTIPFQTSFFLFFQHFTAWGCFLLLLFEGPLLTLLSFLPSISYFLQQPLWQLCHHLPYQLSFLAVSVSILFTVAKLSSVVIQKDLNVFFLFTVGSGLSKCGTGAKSSKPTCLPVF